MRAAKTAAQAFAQMLLVEIDVGLALRRGRVLKRRIAQRLGGLGENFTGGGAPGLRIGKLTRARALERIAAGLFYAVKIARLAADAVDVFKLIIVRFQFIIGEAPILTGAVFGEQAFAVLCFGGAAQNKFFRQKAPCMTTPVRRRAADDFAGLE